MRLLIDRTAAGEAATEPAPEVTDVRLRALYAVPRTPWLRVNMVSTLDGAATGAGGKSGSINNPADHRVFSTLRSLADAVVVGAGTARTEGYRPAALPIVLVTRRAEVPERLRGAPRGSVHVATCGSAPGLADARSALGADQVVVAGEDRVDLVAVLERLHERGFTSLLGEGGPHLLADLLDAGVVDEVCVTLTPLMVAGEHPRIALGPDVDVPLELRLLLEDRGTLLARWFVDHRRSRSPITVREGVSR